MDEKLYTLGFSAFVGIGTIRYEKLIKVFGSAKNAWHMLRTDLNTILGKAIGEKFDEFRKEFDIEKYAREVEQKGIVYFVPTDEGYPKLLKQMTHSSTSEALAESRSTNEFSTSSNNNKNWIPHQVRDDKEKSVHIHPPFILFAKGNVVLLHNNKTIGIVGTRKVTEYGRHVTQMFTRNLVEQGFTIVSGMALGVDGIAHAEALKNNGSTIAVLGSGVDVPTPREHAGLYQQILENNGLIVSTFSPGEDAHIGSFPARNTTIAGLSLGILVTEGAEDSGALITARDAKQLNRPIFAVPGQITSQLSVGTNNLIKQGAVAVSSAYDIIDNLRAVIPDQIGDPGDKHLDSRFRGNDKRKKGDTQEEQKIIILLGKGSLHFDEIARTIGKDSKAIGSLLSLMELKGLVKSLSDGKYCLV